MDSNQSRAVIETLETRRLLSVSPIALDGGTLHVTGAAQHANTVIVYRSEDKIEVNLVTFGSDGTEMFYSGTFDQSEVAKVIVTGGAMDDLIQVGSGDDQWLIPVSVDAGAGNDSIYTGNGNDHIRAGEGSDTIDSGLGDDIVIDNTEGGATGKKHKAKHAHDKHKPRAEAGCNGKHKGWEVAQHKAAKARPHHDFGRDEVHVV